MVGAVLVAMMSFAAIGMPWSGPRSTPFASSASVSAASASAISGIVVMNEPSVGFSASILSRWMCVSSTLVMVPARRAAAASLIVIGVSNAVCPSPDPRSVRATVLIVDERRFPVVTPA